MNGSTGTINMNISLNLLWNNHVMNVMNQTGLSWGEAMKEASKTFEKVKLNYGATVDLLKFHKMYIESVKTNISGAQMLCQIIAYLKDLRCELNDKERYTKEKAIISLRFLEEDLILANPNLNLDDKIFKDLLLREKRKIEIRKYLTEIWMKYIRNEKYTYFSNKYRHPKGSYVEYNVNTSVNPDLNYDQILDEIIWWLNYKMHKLNNSVTIMMMVTYYLWYILCCWKPKFLCMNIRFKHISGFKQYLILFIMLMMDSCEFMQYNGRMFIRYISGVRYW